MSFYRLARPARADLLAIAVRSAEGWGAQHAANYIAGLFDVFEQQAAMPGLADPAFTFGPDCTGSSTARMSSSLDGVMRAAFVSSVSSARRWSPAAT